MQSTFEKLEWLYVDGKTVELSLPKKAYSDEATLGGVLDEILAYVSMSRGSQNVSSIPLHRPKSYLKRLIYQLGRLFLIKGKAKQIETSLRARVRATGGVVQSKNGTNEAEKLFQLALRALSAPEDKIVGGELTRLSRALARAYYENVPQEYLIGYIYQAVGSNPKPIVPSEVKVNEWDIDDEVDDEDSPREVANVAKPNKQKNKIKRRQPRKIQTPTVPKELEDEWDHE